MNKAILLGRFIRDPELRTSAAGGDGSFCRFTIAVDRAFRSKDSSQPTADFISCVCFGKTAEFVEKWFHKGDPVVVEGRIQTGSYEKDGQRVYTTDIMVERTGFVPKNNGIGEVKSDIRESYGQRDASESKRQDTFRDIPEGVDEELPFN
jgi:single-strand DNA-binding protein